MAKKYDTEADMDKKMEEGKRSARMEGLRKKGYSEADAVKMVSMKREPKKKEDKDEVSAPTPVDETYPYGLRVRLENEDLEKLGIDTLPEVGKEITITAEAVVQSVSSNEHLDSKRTNRSVELQITAMKFDKDASA